jgi:hypothetical protein
VRGIRSWIGPVRARNLTERPRPATHGLENDQGEPRAHGCARFMRCAPESNRSKQIPLWLRFSHFPCSVLLGDAEGRVADAAAAGVNRDKMKR